MPGAESNGVAFVGSTGTLKLHTSQSFIGLITGFSGDGTLAGSDQIDLTNFAYNGSIQSSAAYNSATGVLTFNNGAATSTLHFSGSYVLANFKFASDGHSGTIVYDPPVIDAQSADPTSAQAVGIKGSADTFTFPVHFGNNTVVNFETTQAVGADHDVLQFDHTDFATAAEALTAAHQSGSDTVIALNGNTVTLHGIDVTTLHLSDFHIV